MERWSARLVMARIGKKCPWDTVCYDTRTSFVEGSGSPRDSSQHCPFQRFRISGLRVCKKTELHRVIILQGQSRSSICKNAALGSWAREAHVARAENTRRFPCEGEREREGRERGKGEKEGRERMISNQCMQATTWICLTCRSTF